MSTLETLFHSLWRASIPQQLETAQPDPPGECCCLPLQALPFSLASLCRMMYRILILLEEESLSQVWYLHLRKNLFAHLCMRTHETLSVLERMTARPLIQRVTESHCPGLVKARPCTPRLDKREAFSPSFQASVNPFLTLLGCLDFMAQISQDPGDQSLIFQKIMWFLTVMGQEHLHL